MHTDEQKKFDVRTIERKMKGGILTPKDYEAHLYKLPDVSEKVFNPEESPDDFDTSEASRGEELSSKKKEMKKKVKAKGK